MTVDYSKRGSDPEERRLAALAAIAATKMTKKPAPRWALIAAGLEPALSKDRSDAAADGKRNAGDE